MYQPKMIEDVSRPPEKDSLFGEANDKSNNRKDFAEVAEAPPESIAEAKTMQMVTNGGRA